MNLRGCLWIFGQVLRTIPDLTARVDNPMYNLLVALWIINTSGLLAHKNHRLNNSQLQKEWCTNSMRESRQSFVVK